MCINRQDRLLRKCAKINFKQSGGISSFATQPRLEHKLCPSPDPPVADHCVRGMCPKLCPLRWAVAEMEGWAMWAVRSFGNEWRAKPNAFVALLYWIQREKSPKTQSLNKAEQQSCQKIVFSLFCCWHCSVYWKESIQSSWGSRRRKASFSIENKVITANNNYDDEVPIEMNEEIYTTTRMDPMRMNDAPNPNARMHTQMKKIYFAQT